MSGPFGQPKFETWIDRQIREAQERGAFDNLPGAGKPIDLGKPGDDDWWIKQKLRNEDMRGALPTSLSLKREREDLQTTLADVRTEREAREIVDDLNARIMDARARRVEGPPLFIQTADVEAEIQAWKIARETKR